MAQEKTKPINRMTDQHLTIQQALDNLHSSDQREQHAAIEMLGNARHTAAVPPLTVILLNADSGTRYIAGLALGKIAHEEAVPGLLQALEGDDLWVRLAVTDALIKIGIPSVSGLIDAVRHDNKAVRRAAAKALGKIGDAAAVPALRNALDDGDDAVRRFAAEALDRLEITD